MNLYYRWDKKGRDVFLPDHNQMGKEFDVSFWGEATEAFLRLWDDESLRKMRDKCVESEIYETAELIKTILNERNEEGIQNNV